jgi:hypothetical protein
MLQLAFDRAHRVLRVTVSGIYASADMEELDRVVIDALAREGRPMRGIYDYTEVEAFAVPLSRLLQRAQHPALMRDQRVIVASRIQGGAGARDYGRYQREAGEKEAVVVQTLQQAYKVLRLKRPQFEPFDAR